jgi:apolipoprotein D and lipocalin family protein
VEERWQEAEGTAYFVRGEDEGYLKVSFFGPFYGAYVVFGLDRERYRYAFVSGNSRDYLWLLARTPAVEHEVLERFLARAAELGFDTGKLIYVVQD